MKIPRVIQIIGIFLSIAALPLIGQDGLVTKNRFVTLISSKYEEGFVSLSFESIKDPNLQYRIYRSDKPIISQADIERSTLIAEISAGEIPLKDSPGIDGKFYYAVTVAEEFSGLIPYLNTTTSPIDFSPLPGVIDTFNITELDHENGKHRLSIQFIPATDEYTYNLYTGMTLIKKLDDTELRATVTGADGRFELSVQENMPVFMAITALNRLGVENKTLIPGRNVTSEPFLIKDDEGERVVKKSEMEPVQETSPEDREKPKVDELRKVARTLSPGKLIEQNLRSNFYTGNYGRALDNFRSILSRGDLTMEERGSATFHAGQCSYYLRDYEQAVKYFILSKEVEGYERMADAWIERSLSRIQ
jgi:hypothetical protein